MIWEGLGVVLQWLALYLAVEVCVKFLSSNKEAHLAWSDPAAALSLAIFLHFLAGVLDGTYWQIAWSAKFHGVIGWQTIFNNGILANIPFRHILPSIVAVLHLRAISLNQHTSMNKYYVRGAVVVALGIAQVTLL